MNPNRLSGIIGSAVIATTEIISLPFRALAADLESAEEAFGAVYKAEM
jgi:hypothetical protein